MTDPPNSTGAPYEGRMLMLPWARVLFAADTGDIYNYVPDNRKPREEWRPVITCVPGFMLAGGSYTLQDRQVTGLSHLSVYCDDATMASHYPIVRLRHANGNVYDSRTFEHSTIGVAPGAALHTTNFYIPAQVPSGGVRIEVVSNSEPRSRMCNWRQRQTWHRQRIWRHSANRMPSKSGQPEDH